MFSQHVGDVDLTRSMAKLMMFAEMAEQTMWYDRALCLLFKVEEGMVDDLTTLSLLPTNQAGPSRGTPM